MDDLLSREDEPTCLTCRSADPLKLGVCPQCASRSGRADTLVFLVLPSGSRLDAVAVVSQAFPGRFSPSQLREVLDGDRPLCVVPSNVANRLAAQLAGHGVTTRIVSKRDIGGVLPARFRRILLMVLLSGTIAGALSDPRILWLTPMVALVLGLLAYGTNTRRGLRPSQRLRAADGDRGQVLDTLIDLRPGIARDLLSRIVDVETAFHMEKNRHVDTPIGNAVRDLILAACDTAQNLESIEQQLTQLRAMSTGHTSDRTMFDHHEELCETRDRLVGALQQAGRVASHAGRVGSTATETAIVETTEALRLQIDAYREVETLLGS